MSYSTIKNPPINETIYVWTPPEGLMALLQQGAARVVTSDMIGSLDDTISFATLKGYQVSMMRNDDSSDPGGCMSMTGRFYFHLP
jgi:hypothetical protein